MRLRGTKHTTFEHWRKLMESAVVVDPYANFRSRIGCSPVEEQKIYALLCLYPFDVRAEFLQFFVKMFVAAVDVIDTANFGDAVGLQSG